MTCATYAAPLSDADPPTWCPVCRVAPIRKRLLTCSGSCSATQRNRREYRERRRAAGLPMWCSWVGCVQPMQAGDRTRDGRARLFCSSCTALGNHKRASPHVREGEQRRLEYQVHRRALLRGLYEALAALVPCAGYCGGVRPAAPGSRYCAGCGNQRAQYMAVYGKLPEQCSACHGPTPKHRRLCDRCLPPTLEQLVEEQNGRCQRCGTTVTLPHRAWDDSSAERDHIIPRCAGPYTTVNRRGNIQLLCRGCNRAKADTCTAEELDRVASTVPASDRALHQLVQAMKKSPARVGGPI